MFCDKDTGENNCSWCVQREGHLRRFEKEGAFNNTHTGGWLITSVTTSKNDKGPGVMLGPLFLVRPLGIEPRTTENEP
jgi:hypothetical protein